MWSIFSCTSWPSVCLLWRNVYLRLLPTFGLGCLFFLILSCMSCLYILEINPLSVASFANIFSHSEGCLFVLFMVSFAVQKLLSFIRAHLFIFGFISISLGGGSKKSCFNSILVSTLLSNLWASADAVPPDLEPLHLLFSSFRVNPIAATSKRLPLIPTADIISPSSKFPNLLGTLRHYPRPIGLESTF